MKRIARPLMHVHARAFDFDKLASCKTSSMRAIMLVAKHTLLIGALLLTLSKVDAQTRPNGFAYPGDSVPKDALR